MFAANRRNRWCAGLSVLVAAAAACTRISRAGPEEPDSLPTYELDPVEIVGRGWSLPGEGAAFAFSVLEGATLARAGVLGLADALAPLPGVRVARFGAPGSFSSVSVRGTRNEQVLVLVDGRRLSPAQGGGVDLGAIDAGALERVEVLRGGASALHGGGALGGVINLVTRPRAGRSNATRARVEGGSFGTLAGVLRHERAAGQRGRLWMSGHALGTRGDYSYSDRGITLERSNAGARASGGTIGVELGAAPGVRITLDGALETGDQNVPGTVEFPTPEAQRADRRASIGAEVAFADRLAPGIRLVASVHELRQRRSYEDPPQSIDDRHVNRSSAVEIRLDAAPAARGAGADVLERPVFFTSTIELRRDALASSSDGDRARRSAGIVLRAQRARGRILFAPAARFDARSDGAPFLSPRLALRVDLPRSSNLRLAAGRSYRPPSFDDLFFPDVGGAVGNPGLRPESAFDAELGVSVAFGHPPGARRTSLAASLYEQHIDDLIQWSPGPDGRWRPHNVGKAVLRGLEIEGRTTQHLLASPRPAQLTATLDLLDPRNATGEPNVDGRRLPYRPAVEGYVELELPLASRLDVIAAWHGVGRSFVTEANTKSIPGHGLVHVTLELMLAGKAAPNRLVASLAVLNLADIEAVDVRDYPLPGREWRLALRLAAPEMP